MNYIYRSILHLTETCESIFKLLRKNQAIEWNEDIQGAFENIQQYLQEPPILIPSTPDRLLIMYLIVLDKSMRCVMGQHDKTNRKEHAIYYLSKKFTDYETRYSLLEKTCCALEWICRTTLLISKMDPIKHIFEKPSLNGRIAHWQMLLSEYDIQCVMQKAIKGSMLVDHPAHHPVDDYQLMKFDFPNEDIMVIKDCEFLVLMKNPNLDPDGVLYPMAHQMP